jgi:putative transposase
MIPLIGAVLAEQTDEWAEGHRCLGPEILASSRLHPITTSSDTAGLTNINRPAADTHP